MIIQLKKPLILDSEEKINLSTISVIGVGLFINYFFFNDYISFLSTLVSLVWLMICPFKYVLANAVYFSFFSYLFNFGKYNFYFFVIGVAVIRYVFQNKQNIVYAIFFLTYCLAHFHSTHLYSFSFGLLIPGIAMTFLLMAINYRSNITFPTAKRYFSYGFFLSSALGIFKNYTRIVFILDQDFVSGTDVARFSGLSADANFYTVLAVLEICLLLYKKNHSKLNDFCLLAACIFGCMTFSKSFYLCLLVIIVLGIIFSDLKAKKSILLFIVFTFVLYIIFRNQINGYLNIIINRFTSANDFNSLTTGRSDLWKKYWTAYINNLDTIIYGYGANATLGKAAHNTYIQMFYEYGLIGFLFDIIVLLYELIRIIKRHPQKNTLAYVPLMSIIVLLFNLSAYAFYSLWCCVLIAFLYIGYPNEDEEGSTIINRAKMRIF